MEVNFKTKTIAFKLHLPKLKRRKILGTKSYVNHLIFKKNPFNKKKSARQNPPPSSLVFPSFIPFLIPSSFPSSFSSCPDMAPNNVHSPLAPGHFLFTSESVGEGHPGKLPKSRVHPVLAIPTDLISTTQTKSVTRFRTLS